MLNSTFIFTCIYNLLCQRFYCVKHVNAMMYDGHFHSMPSRLEQFCKVFLAGRISGLQVSVSGHSKEADTKLRQRHFSTRQLVKVSFVSISVHFHVRRCLWCLQSCTRWSFAMHLTWRSSALRTKLQLSTSCSPRSITASQPPSLRNLCVI